MNNLILENAKIDYAPLVRVYHFFKVVKHKTDVKGFWIDKGKIYIDNIDIVTISGSHIDYLDALINFSLCNSQLAVFYKNIYNEGIIQYKDGKKQVLKNRTAWVEKHLKPSYVKTLLAQYGGLTIYRLKEGYLIEIYK